MSSTKRIEVYLGGSEDIHVVDLTEPKTINSLAAAVRATGRLGDAAEPEILFFEEDAEQEIPRDRVYDASHHGKRLHAHTCRVVAVTFIHVDERREHAFSPSVTIGSLLQWAKHRFPVDQSTKYTLRLSADGEPLPHAAHLGSYTRPGVCSVTLYFVPACRIQG